MKIDTIIEEYKEINCPYILKKSIEKLQNSNLDKINLKNLYTLQGFLESDEFKELESKYSYYDLKLNIVGLSGNPFIYNIKEKVFYDKDMNKIDIKDKNKSRYKINRIIEVVCLNNDYFKDLTLKEYIEMMKKYKELHIYLHELVLDYNYGIKVYVLFGENETIVLDDYNMNLMDDDTEFEQKISSINLIQE